MSGLDGYGVELDIYNNSSCGDSNANHVGIDQLTSCGGGQPTSLFESPDLTGTVNLFDANWHAAVVTLSSGWFTVTIDDHSVAEEALVGFATGTSYYYGFAGGLAAAMGASAPRPR